MGRYRPPAPRGATEGFRESSAPPPPDPTAPATALRVIKINHSYRILPRQSVPSARARLRARPDYRGGQIRRIRVRVCGRMRFRRSMAAHMPRPTRAPPSSAPEQVARPPVASGQSSPRHQPSSASARWRLHPVAGTTSLTDRPPHLILQPRGLPPRPTGGGPRLCRPAARATGPGERVGFRSVITARRRHREVAKPTQ
jgi:hypothetical protein